MHVSVQLRAHVSIVDHQLLVSLVHVLLCVMSSVLFVMSTCITLLIWVYSICLILTVSYRWLRTTSYILISDTWIRVYHVMTWSHCGLSAHLHASHEYLLSHHDDIALLLHDQWVQDTAHDDAAEYTLTLTHLMMCGVCCIDNTNRKSLYATYRRCHMVELYEYTSEWSRCVSTEGSVSWHFIVPHRPTRCSSSLLRTVYRCV